jgi:hypothetical protein
MQSRLMLRAVSLNSVYEAEVIRLNNRQFVFDSKYKTYARLSFWEIN